MKRLGTIALVVLSASCGGSGAHQLASRPAPANFEARAYEHPTTTTEAPRPTTTHASRSLVHPRPTVPRVQPAPTYAGDWVSLIASLPWDSATALRIVRCESGGNPNAYNRSSGATGLFQILNGPFDPIANVRTAFGMWQSRGWQPWYSSARCWRS